MAKRAVSSGIVHRSEEYVFFGLFGLLLDEMELEGA
jgi:hypothetical protein